MGVGVLIDENNIVENIINLEQDDPVIDGLTCIYLQDRGVIDIGWLFSAPDSFSPPS